MICDTNYPVDYMIYTAEMSTEYRSSQVDLSGKSLSNLAALRKYDRAKCKSLNLHNNFLNDISDLPRFLFLTELNISSNRLKNVPDLSFLPALESLDVSGNMIESVLSLSFMPALKSLKLAYNCIKSLHGLTSANIPSVEYLDLRENPIIVTEHEIQPIGTLYHLKDISINTSKITTIALLFTTCPSLQSVDRKSQAAWKEYASKQLLAEATPTEISTPHFDKVAAKYRNGATHNSPPTQLHGISSLTSPMRSSYRGTKANPQPTSPSLIPQYVRPTPPATLDESTQMTVSSDTTDSHTEHARLLSLQRTILSHTRRHAILRTKLITQAFSQFKQYALYIAYQEQTKQQHQTHAHEIATLRAELSRTTQEATQTHQHLTSAIKQQQDESTQKIVQLEALLGATRTDLENEREKYASARLAHAQLQHTLDAAQEHAHRQLEDQEIKLKALEAQESRNKEQNDITLRELEAALSESSTTIEKLRFELAYCRERLAQSDDRVGNTQQAVASAQHEKAECFARALALEKQLALEKDDFHTQLKEVQAEKDELTASLAAAKQELSLLHADTQGAKVQREKAEQRLRQLHEAFETIKNELNDAKAENAVLRERDTKNAAALKEVTRGARKLQEIIELRKQNCEKCGELDKQLRAVRRDREEDLRVCEKVKLSLQSSNEQHTQLQAEHRTLLAKLADSTAEVTYLQAHVQSLQNRLTKETAKMASPPPKSAPVTPSKADTDRLNKLDTALKVKDTMLNDQAAEITELKRSLQEVTSKFKACESDFFDLEMRYERRKRDCGDLEAQCQEYEEQVRRLRQELSHRSESEVQLQTLIAQFQQNDDLCDPSSAAAASVNKQLFTTGTSGDLQSQHSQQSQHSHSSDRREHLSIHSTSSNARMVSVVHEKHDFSIHPGRKGVCVNAQCVQEKQQLQRDLEEAIQELQVQQEQHDKLYRLKNEECAKFAQAVTQLEVNSVSLASDIRSEKEKFEAAIERYRSEKRKLQRQCLKLEEELKSKENELARTQAATEQLQGAFANFQKIGNTLK